MCFIYVPLTSDLTKEVRLLYGTLQKFTILIDIDWSIELPICCISTGHHATAKDINDKIISGIHNLILTYLCYCLFIKQNKRCFISVLFTSVLRSVQYWSTSIGRSMLPTCYSLYTGHHSDFIAKDINIEKKCIYFFYYIYLYLLLYYSYTNLKYKVILPVCLFTVSLSVQN